jgi:hypothetical protein
MQVHTPVQIPLTRRHHGPVKHSIDAISDFLHGSINPHDDNSEALAFKYENPGQCMVIVPARDVGI